MDKTARTEAAVPGPLAVPLYRMDRSFEENVAAGPEFDGPYPAVPATPLKDFFGYPVASRLGIAASLVLNPGWAEVFSRLGFDILTYKTVRSCSKLAHPQPNWLYPDQRTVTPGQTPMRLGLGLPAEPAGATAVGSIGMPSVPPEVWRKDIRTTRAKLRAGQVLVVSVVGTTREATSRAAFVEDFAWLAEAVVEAGAQVVELNLSCPNVEACEGELYLDAGLSAEIASAVRKRIGRTVPVLAKIGAIDDDDRLKDLLVRLDPQIDGVVMINAPSRELLDHAGEPAFGEGRRTAGMMGGATFDIGLDCVRRAVAIVRDQRLGLRVLAVGGATTPERIAAYFDAGAYAVMGASALAWDPYLAIRTKHLYPGF